MDLTPARRPTSRSRVGLVLLGLAAVALALYLMTGGRSSGTTSERSPRPSASASPLAATTIRGALIPRLEAHLASAVSGALVEVMAPIGTTVELGQPILRVDGTSQAEAVKIAEASVRRARAALSQARTERSSLPRSATSGERRVAAAATVVADAAYQLELSKLAAAKAEAALTTMVAPFAGTVTAVDAQIGERVDPGTPVVTLADSTTWLVRAFVPEAIAVQLKPGDAVSVSIAAIPRLGLRGTIADIGLTPSPEAPEDGYPVVVEVTGSDPRLRAGLAADVAFTIAR